MIDDSTRRLKTNASSVLCYLQFYKSTGIMNVSTVFPEGLTETERSQRRATTSIKDDEEAQDRYNRK